MIEKIITKTSLGKALMSLLEDAKGKDITILTIYETLAGRGFPILLILFSLPFSFPITIPGLSTPFGLLLAFLGLRIAFGQHPWWPKWILNKTVSFATLEKIVENLLWFIQKLQPFIHP